MTTETKAIVESEVREAYADSWLPWGKEALDRRNLSFKASQPIGPGELSDVLAIIGPYNSFGPAPVALAIQGADPKATIWVAREGSPCLYIRTTAPAAMRATLLRVEADEIGTEDGVIRAWWD
ncbi:hypothetical protein LCGC14_1251980 [marine sediment metagenome]|uniref:Uncharacterized protein n=1 Tax=marine sediment metagenome TaxID=412755 RepID=A0A0F9NJU7_9ZZZZ